jgi:hypothetical protein
MEAVVFRRSEAGGGDSAFLFEVLRDSHENGLVSLRETEGVEAAFSWAGGAGGGGGNLTGDILPDRPWVVLAELRESRGGSLGAWVEAFAPSVHRQLTSTHVC